MVTESTYGLAWEDGFTLDMRRFLSLCELEMLFFFLLPTFDGSSAESETVPGNHYR